MRISVWPALAAAVSVLATGGAAWADEGMWTFDNFPSAQVKQKYGVVIDQAWLDRVRAGTARIPGCSASVVSPQGLVLTNYHCVATCVQNLSTAGRDFLKDGYSALPADEKRCPGMWLEILTSITDVTGRVKAAGAGKTGAELVKAIDAAGAAAEKEGCTGKAGHRCQVISFYGGGQYKLYDFRRYDDVRMVLAPEFKTGFFGGDPDNFNFPRYNLDFGLVRIYDGGKPVQAPWRLKWNPETPKPGEPVFVVGNPGATERLLTVSELEIRRDMILPLTTIRASERRGRIIRFSEESPENARVSQDVLEFLENGYKVNYGRLQALHDPAFFATKVEEEKSLRARVAADPALARTVGDPWAEIASAQAAERELYLPYTTLEGGPPGSQLFAWARQIVRAARAQALPADQRPAEFTEARLAQAQQALVAPRPIEPALEQLNLEFWLSKAREDLTVDDPVTKLLLGRESPESVSHAIVDKSRLGDPAERLRLWQGGLAAVQSSDDPMIRLALAIDPAAQALREQWRARVIGPTTSAKARIAQARFAVFGERLYPDATFSPRITYGAVEGWNERGKAIAPLTTLAGLFERATGQSPFDLPQSWYRGRDKAGLNLSTPFDVSASLDIIGGNSGSPTLNARGEVIGAAFDGNIHSLGGDYGYDPRLNRSASVTAAAIQEALLKVYDRPDLVRELNSR